MSQTHQPTDHHHHHQKPWSTWDELLLASAVKRHGLKDWDTIAIELQSRVSLPLLLTAQICENKYIDLKLRYTNNDKLTSQKEEEEGNSIPWLEELRKLRVRELKQEVLLYDRSIQDLQLKVKRLEEEESKQTSKNYVVEKPDLDKARSKNDGEIPDKISPEKFAGKLVSGEDSDKDNRSFNESNSTENREAAIVKLEPEHEPVRTGDVGPDQDSDPNPKPGGGGEDSCNESSTSRPSQEEEDRVDSGELRDSVGDSKESSDMQSSASLTRKRRRRVEVEGCGGDGTVVMGEERIIKRVVKSEPLVGVLDIIRSHKHGTVFERRLESQKTDKYSNIIRQHVDLQTVQTRIDNGSYSSCTSRFYVDLLLLFNNAIVFFPKASLESIAAHELRKLLSKNLKNHRLSSEPKLELEKSDSLLAKHKSTTPILVCRKRSCISAKTSSVNNKTEKLVDEKPVVNPKLAIKSSSSVPNEEEITPMKLRAKDKPVTGTRSMRRSGKGRQNTTKTESNHQNTNSSSKPGYVEKPEAAKAEKKKNEVITMAKKRGAADFLRRIKKNSPGKGTLAEALKSHGDDVNNGGSRRENGKKRVEEWKNGMMRRSGNGGGKRVKEENSPSKRSVGRPPKKGKDGGGIQGKRGREGGDVEGSSKRPNKRSKR